jgi:hypothetical protein
VPAVGKLPEHHSIGHHVMFPPRARDVHPHGQGQAGSAIQRGEVTVAAT